MKHPETGKYLIELWGVATDEALKRSDITVYHDPTGKHNGNFTSGEDAAKLAGYQGMQPYVFNDDNDPTVQVDYEAGVVLIHDRGGWGLTHKLHFADLEDLATLWEVRFDVGDTTEEVATTAYKLHQAEWRRKQGHYDIFPMPAHRFLPTLPTPASGEHVYKGHGDYDSIPYYTEEQMRDYGEKCIRNSQGKE